MPSIAEKLLSVCPIVVAALLLLARALCESLALPAPTVVAILAATKVPRSTAYEQFDVLVALLPTLVRARGRPPRGSVLGRPSGASTDSSALTRAVLRYVMSHPGCVHGGAVRQHYSDAFRRFVVELRAEHAAVEIEAFADATALPFGTLKDWLRTPIIAVDATELAAPVRPSAEGAQMQTVELVEHDVAEQRGQRAALRRPLLRTHHHPVGHGHLGLQHLADEAEHTRIAAGFAGNDCAASVNGATGRLCSGGVGHSKPQRAISVGSSVRPRKAAS